MHVDADLHTAAVAAIDAAVGRLGGDDELDLAARIFRTEIFIDDGLPAHAVAVLFLHGADDHDLVALGDEALFLHDLRAVRGSCHAALLVRAAAAIDDVVGLIALVGVVRPVFAVADADGVDVGVDGDDLIALAHPADDVAELVKFDLVIAELLHFLGDALDNALFLTGLGRNPDHVPKELCHVGLIAFSRCFNLFIIHKPASSRLFILFILTAYRSLCLHHTTTYAVVKQNFCQPEFFSEKALISAKTVI